MLKECLINFTAINLLRLLHIPFVHFGSPQGDPQRHVGSNVMLITAEGQLVDLSVPQHLLLRSGRSHSRDLLLLRKLPQAITVGDTDLIATAFDTLAGLSLRCCASEGVCMRCLGLTVYCHVWSCFV